ncbi:MAG: hypothetical protein AAF447_08415 [Myxococcota bacterium]
MHTTARAPRRATWVYVVGALVMGTLAVGVFAWQVFRNMERRTLGPLPAPLFTRDDLPPHPAAPDHGFAAFAALRAGDVALDGSETGRLNGLEDCATWAECVLIVEARAPAIVADVEAHAEALEGLTRALALGAAFVDTCPLGDEVPEDEGCQHVELQDALQLLETASLAASLQGEHARALDIAEDLAGALRDWIGNATTLPRHELAAMHLDGALRSYAIVVERSPTEWSAGLTHDVLRQPFVSGADVAVMGEYVELYAYLAQLAAERESFELEAPRTVRAFNDYFLGLVDYARGHAASPPRRTRVHSPFNALGRSFLRAAMARENLEMLELAARDITYAEELRRELVARYWR